MAQVQELPRMPRNLKIGHELHKGSHGAVHEGMFAAQRVAVKFRNLPEKASERERVLRSFSVQSERDKLQLEHPNVISEQLVQQLYAVR